MLAADADGKIGKKVAKLAQTFASSCVGVNLPTILPGVCGSSGAPSSCLHTRTTCRVCQMFNAIDALAIDCDEMDDGSDNGSCN